MTSLLTRIGELFAQVFSFGRQVLSSPFFDHVFAIAGLLYPPAAPIIGAVDRLFEQKNIEGFLEQLEPLLKQSGVGEREAELVKHLVSLFFLTGTVGGSSSAQPQKAALAREIIKSAIASNGGQFRVYGVSAAIERLYGRKIRGPEDKEQVPDHLVNFSIELAVVQQKFNRMLDQLIAYAQTAMQPLVEAAPEQLEEVLDDGRRRGLWTYTQEDYQKAEVRRAVAAVLTKEEAIEEKFLLWGRPVTSREHIPDCLANFAVEACYSDFRLGLSQNNGSKTAVR